MQSMQPCIWLRGWPRNWCWHGRIGFDESAIVKEHISDGRVASVWAILPAGIVKLEWYAKLAAYVVDGIWSGIWVEFDGIVWVLL